jgi:hypothetical protein
VFEIDPLPRGNPNASDRPKIALEQVHFPTFAQQPNLHQRANPTSAISFCEPQAHNQAFGENFESSRVEPSRAEQQIGSDGS